MAGRKQSEAEQAGVLVWGKITASLSEILAPLIIVRLLGQGEVGAVAGLLLIYTTLATLLTAGFPRATLYFLADQTPGGRRGTVERLSVLMGILAVAMAGVLALIGWFGSDLLMRLGELISGDAGAREDDELANSLRYLPILGLFALFDLPPRILPNVLVAEQRARASAGFGVLRSLVGTLALIVPASMGLGVLEIVLFMTVSGAVPFLVFLRHLRKLYGEVEREAGSSTRELVRYSLPLGATDVVSMLNANVDMWLIVALFPAEMVAVYRVGAFQIPLITTIAYSLGAVYLPRFTRLHRAGERREAIDIWRHSIGKVSLIVVPAAVVFLVAAEEFVVLAFTEDYAAAAPVFRFYCLLVMMRVTAFGSFMIAAGKPGFVLRSALLTLLANVVISVPLALTLGFLGPAVGTAISFVPMVAFYCWYIAQAWEVRLRDTLPLLGYLKVVAVAGVPAAGAWMVKQAIELHPGLEFGIVAGVVLLGYSLLGTALGMIEREDWAFAWGWLRLKVLRD